MSTTRQVKFAEAAIVFVLALGLTVFLGMKIFGGAAEKAVSTATETEEAWPSSLVTDAGPQVDPAPVIEEPVAEVASEPELPTFVTYATAEAAFFEGDYQQASEMFATYCEDHPENAWGHYMRGLSLRKAGETDAAADAFRRALELKPDHLKSLVNLARTELDRQQPEAALVAVEEAVQIAPDNVDARRVLGRVYHELDRTEDAVDAYTQALRGKLDDPWTLNNLGLLYIQTERFEDALAPLARAAQLAPEVAVIHNNLGIALERSGQMELAHEQYARAIELAPAYANAEDNLLRTTDLSDPAGTEPLDLALVAAGFSVEGDAVAVAP